MRITEKKSLMKTIVIGRNVLFATLNQINEKDQKIIEKTTAPYIFNCLFNLGIRLSKFFEQRIYS
jgi:hypothetical protein